MAHIVGTKGQVVIGKEIRERLGVQPGWLALQRVVDDHVEMRFVPPEHSESLLGVLAPYIKTSIPSEEEFHQAAEEAWSEAAAERDARVVSEWQET